MMKENEHQNDDKIDYESEDDEAPMLVNVDGPEQAIAPAEKQPTGEDALLPPCPVTILSGFLGSGKTTLVQYILQSPDHGKRIAVIENEFGGGDEGLSVENIIARDGANQDSLADLIELPNGCICCTVKDSLVATLENLLEKKSDLDYILIEASGMANPGPIASLFWLDEALESRLRLDGVVTLVDALNVEYQLEQTEEAAQQIAYADRILLNKVDLVNHDTERLLNVIRSIHPTAPIRTTTYSQIPDLEWILDAKCFDIDRAKDVNNELSRVVAENAASHYCTDASSCATCAQSSKPPSELCGVREIPDFTSKSNAHTHTSAVGTVALVHAGSVDLARVNKWLAFLLWPKQDEQNSVLKARLEAAETTKEEDESKPSSSTETQIFRIKGILSVQHDDVEKDLLEFVDERGVDDRRYIVQAVHDLWEIHAASDDLRWSLPLNGEAAPTERSCKLVVIGRYLREGELMEDFRNCFVDAQDTNA